MLTNLNYVLCGIIIILGFSFLLGSYNEGSYDHPLLVHNSITAHKQSLGQGNILAPVCHSVHRGVVCPSACLDTPPGIRGTPQQQIPPRSRYTPQCMLGDTGNKRVVRILLECILVFKTIDLILVLIQTE